MSRSHESIDAIRQVWMEGYNHARREMGLGPRLVMISENDIRQVFEPGTCAHPRECPCSSPSGEEKR